MNRLASSVSACIFAVSLCSDVAFADAPASGPTAEHKRLEFFVGEWKVEGKLHDGKTFQSSDSCEWFDGKFAVVCNAIGTTGYKSLAIISYSPDQKAYGYYSITNEGRVGGQRGVLQGDVWTFTPETSGGQKAKLRITARPRSTNEFSLTIEAEGQDGKWMVLEETKYTRK